MHPAFCWNRVLAAKIPPPPAGYARCLPLVSVTDSSKTFVSPGLSQGTGLDSFPGMNLAMTAHRRETIVRRLAARGFEVIPGARPETASFDRCEHRR
jgi:hypothetical protein